MAAVLSLPAFAAPTETPDKSQFTLLSPTPTTALREMSTDRPDKTESPYTVDAGHFQLEMDLLSYTHDRDNSDGADIRTESYSIAPLNLKVGLLHNVDLQLVMPTYTHERVSDHNAGTSSTESGFGDLITRLKVNLWGNDGGTTAFGVMPFVKFPTHQGDLGNSSVEGGVIFPLAIELPWGWSSGVMTEFDIMRDSANGGHHLEFINSITFGHAIMGNLSGYLEFFSQVSAESGSAWIGTFDAGLTYSLTDNVQLDLGINVGVTSSADDLNLFTGISFRL